MSNALSVVDASAFDAAVLRLTIPTLVDFGAERCAPCRALTPLLEEVAIALRGRVNIVAVDVDANRDLAVRYGVRMLPTLIAFRDGKPVEQLVGAPGRDTLLALAGRLVA